MKKVNIFSVFLFISVALLIYGFSFTKVSAETHISNNEIIENTTWTKANSPYIIDTSIYVHKDVTLTIESGVIVKFNENPDYNSHGYSLDIAGKLIADGTKDPIYFTSNYDDELGGSTDNDYEDCYEDFDEDLNDLGEVCDTYDDGDPSAGDWDGVYFSSSNDSELKNVFFKYADEAITFESSNIEINNLNISDGMSGMTGYDNSSIKIVNGNINNLEGDAFTFWGNSSLDLKDFKIENVWNGFIAFNGSSYIEENGGEEFINKAILKISGLTLSCLNDGITLYNKTEINLIDGDINCGGVGVTIFDNSKIDFSGGSITGGDDGLMLYNGITANINEVKIAGAQDAGIVAFKASDSLDNNITVSKSEITGNSNGFLVWDSPISAHQNSIHDNTVSGATTYDTDPLTLISYDFTSNFWGDKSGPTHSTNPSGTGDVVSDNITFTDFLKYDPLKERKDPIIIVPGIMGTELIRDYGDTDEIWPSVVKLVLSFFDNYLRDLELLPNGDKNIDYPILIGDIIRETPTSNIFGGLITYLTTTGNYIENENLFVFPYDWRLSNKESSRLLEKKINQILIDTDEDKVDVIAHSMGGLVAKKYIINEGKEKVDQLIFLGTPHLGSPKAFKALMYGDDMGTNFGFLSLLNPGVVKDISQNMPSIYELLPSNQYIKNLGEYMSYKGIYMGYDQTKDYMTLNNRNKLMFQYAEELHDGIDGLDLSGVNVYNFANCDKYTIGEIGIIQKIKKGLFGNTTTEDDYRLSYKIGDETVPFISANAEDYGTKYFTKGISHAELPSAKGVKETILSILKKETPNSFNNITTTYSDSYCKTSGKVPSVHSPASMDIYDELGNHTGPNKDGDIEYGIPGVAYDLIGDKKFAFLPDGGDYKVVTKALDIGSYDFYIDSFNINDEKVDTVEFLNIPLTSLNTNAVVDINESITEYKVLLDKEGDGVFESTLNPGDNAPVEKRGGSSGSYISNNLLFGAFNILEPINVVIEENKEELKKEESIPIVKDLENREELKSEITVNNIEKTSSVNNLSASAGSINFDLDKRFILLINIVLSGLIIFVGIKFINKVK